MVHLWSIIQCTGVNELNSESKMQEIKYTSITNQYQNDKRNILILRMF